MAVGCIQYASAKYIIIEDFWIPVVHYPHGKTFLGIKFHPIFPRRSDLLEGKNDCGHGH